MAAQAAGNLFGFILNMKRFSNDAFFLKGNDTLCSLLVCCFPIGLCCVRGNARAARNIDGSVLGDCMAVYCCGNIKLNLKKSYKFKLISLAFVKGCCAAIQIKREFND